MFATYDFGAVFSVCTEASKEGKSSFALDSLLLIGFLLSVGLDTGLSDLLTGANSEGKSSVDFWAIGFFASADLAGTGLYDLPTAANSEGKS